MHVTDNDNSYKRIITPEDKTLLIEAASLLLDKKRRLYTAALINYIDGAGHQAPFTESDFGIDSLTAFISFLKIN
jgi:hypothetical protein